MTKIGKVWMVCFLFAAIAFLFGCSHPSSRSKISRDPTSGPPEAIGGPAAGCLRGGVPLSPSHEGHLVMRLGRQRYYGHPHLIDFIETLGKKIAQKRYPPLLIGDLSLSRGGPMPHGHVSHQNGLDADIWFWSPFQEHDSLESAKHLTLEERETLSAKSLLSTHPTSAEVHQLNELWNERLQEILKWASEDERTQRIFVHPLIKMDLCQKFPHESWTRKIRPWWHHDDHFHVRLHCPPGNSKCLNGPPLPEGNGCDESLEWWFNQLKPASPLKDAPKSSTSLTASAGTARPKVVLPPECEEPSS